MAWMTARATRRGRAGQMAKTALSIGVMSASNLALSGDSLGSNTPLYFGSAVPGAGLGPVLTGANIIPIFWGDWAPFSGTSNDPFQILAYLRGFTRWIGGEGSMYGYDPILRQYGVWGAEVGGYYPFPGSASDVGESDVVNAIHQWQAQGALPENGQTTIFWSC